MLQNETGLKQQRGNIVEGIELVSLKELLAMDLPKREHLIFPWLRQGESALVYAAPGVGKSLFALDLALTVAGGGLFLNQWAAPKTRRVLYVDGEMPLDDIRDRAAMIARGKLKAGQKFDYDKATENVEYAARSKQRPGASFVDLNNEKHQARLLRLIKCGGFELVIFDNLSTLAVIEDENAAGDFNNIVFFFQTLKATGKAFLLLHHTNKTGASYRGSSKIATTFETEMLLKHRTPVNEDGEPSIMTDGCQQTAFSIECPKCRGERDRLLTNGAVATMTSFTDFDTGEKVALWECEEDESKATDLLIGLLQSGKYVSQKELAKALGITQGAVSKRLKRACRKGELAPQEIQACWRKARNARKRTKEIEEEMDATETLEGDLGTTPDF